MSKKSAKKAAVKKSGCATTAVRVPTHLKDDVQAFVQKKINAEGKK